MWHAPLCYQLFIGFLQVKYSLLSDYQRLFTLAWSYWTDWFLYHCFSLLLRSKKKETNRRRRRRNVCTETFILFLLNWALSVVGFAVYAGIGIGDISCFLEHFLNRLEKMMLDFGNMPSSQDPFPASTNAEGPHLALVVLFLPQFRECCNEKEGKRSLDTIPKQAEEYLKVSVGI